MKAWLVFSAMMAVLCLLYPPLLGFVLSVGSCYLAAFLLFKAMGG